MCLSTGCPGRFVRSADQQHVDRQRRTRRVVPVLLPAGIHSRQQLAVLSIERGGRERNVCRGGVPLIAANAIHRPNTRSSCDDNRAGELLPQRDSSLRQSRLAAMPFASRRQRADGNGSRFVQIGCRRSSDRMPPSAASDRSTFDNATAARVLPFERRHLTRRSDWFARDRSVTAKRQQSRTEGDRPRDGSIGWKATKLVASDSMLCTQALRARDIRSRRYTVHARSL